MLAAKRAGITGMGIVSSIGEDVSAFCNSLRTGRSGIKQVAKKRTPQPSVNIAAEIESFSFLELLNRFKNVSDEKIDNARRLGQRAPFPIRTAIISAIEAWHSARLFSSRPSGERIGLIVA